MKEGVKRKATKGVNKEVPVLVKIIAILNIIGVFEISLVLLLLAIFSLGILPFLLPPLLGFIGLIIFSVFLIKGLFKGKRWARTAEIIFLSLLCIGYIFESVILVSIFWNTPNSSIPLPSTMDYFYSIGPVVIISGLIIGYLLFNKKVKEAFS